MNRSIISIICPSQVRDKKEFEFDPANTVLEICRIYTNLQNSNAFCLAVSQDGRSYSPKLFEYAEQVLGKPTNDHISMSTVVI